MAIDYPLVFKGISTFLEPISQASWPIAILAIVLIFRKPLEKLIGRMKQVTAFGHTADFAIADPNQQQSHVASSSTSAPALPQTGTLLPPDPLLERMDTELLALIDNKIEGDDRTKLAWAVRERTITELARRHEANYRVIFGSQITALQTLNQTGDHSVRDIEQVYERDIRPAFPDLHKNRDFAQWGGFLVDAGYVAFVEGSNQTRVQITPLGQGFLQWMVAAQVPQVKPG